MVVVKVAVTVVLPLRVTTQGPVPVQAPLHPVKIVPGFGEAFRVTILPLPKVEVQVPGQESPLGVEVTVPWPVPARVMVRDGVVTIGEKVAVMTVFAVGVSVHGAVPAQPVPLHPVKVIPGSASAVRVMALPPGMGAETQVAPQVIPPIEDVTMPVPVPVFVMVMTGFVTGALNVALMMRGLVRVSVQDPVPVHPLPIHPPKEWPEVGTAVRVMVVPFENEPAQLVGVQTSPGGLEVIVPLPFPSRVTDKVL